jgi:hypothetical protein
MIRSRIAAPCPPLARAGLLLLLLASQAQGQPYTSLAVPGARDFTFDAAGTLYITAGPNVVRYNTGTGTYLSPIAVGGNLLGIDLSPDGQTLAVADTVTQGGTNRAVLINTSTLSQSPVTSPLAFGEGGKFMVAWDATGRLLSTSSYNGSGWVPLRSYDPQSGQTTTLASVRQNTMLTPSADRQTIGLAESNISSGPVSAYRTSSGSITATVNTSWFTFEVAVNRQGSQFIVPTYNGAFVYNLAGTTFTQQTILGQYADHGPIAAVFSPVTNLAFTSEYSWSGTLSGVKMYNTNTWQLISTLDPYDFDWTGNGSMTEGRMEISPDGRFLAVAVNGGVRLYVVPVPEPAFVGVFGGLAVAYLRHRSRRMPDASNGGHSTSTTSGHESS